MVVNSGDLEPSHGEVNNVNFEFWSSECRDITENEILDSPFLPVFFFGSSLFSDR